MQSNSEERFKAIRESYGPFSGKSAIDIGCNDGWFGKLFKQGGGGDYFGYDPEFEEFNNKDFRDKKFDIGIYLNLHYHGSTVSDGYLEWLKSNCDVIFTSPRRGSATQEKSNYMRLLADTFKFVLPIWVGQIEEVIYRCE